MDVSKIVNALKMHESSFKSNLWEAVERLMVCPNVRLLLGIGC